MGSFYKNVREVSQDLIQLLEDLIDNGTDSKLLYENIIEDHQALLRGISDVSIISSTYSKTHKFLQGQMKFFKEKSSFTNIVLCKVMAQRIRGVIIESLSETQPIEIQDPDKKP
jgi:hypothetical protein